MGIAFIGQFPNALVELKTTILKAIGEFEADNVSHFKPVHEAVYQTDFNSHLKKIRKQYVWGTSTEIITAATLLLVSHGQTAFFSLLLGREKKGSGTVRILHSS